MKHDFEYRFRIAKSGPESLGVRPPEYRRTVENGMIIERDVAVRMRDGVRLYVDVFRPVDETPAPPLIGWGPYGKHSPTDYARQFPKAEVDTSKLSRYTGFEAPDPMYWVPRGYAIINVDIRGMWFSEGDATFLSPEEALDFYDMIEWAGTQPWSNGKVGTVGVSYLTCVQYSVAALNPPHLAAINPWEGWSDFYRDIVRHGGIPETEFWGYLPSRWDFSRTRVEDMHKETEEHPFFDSFWASKNADMSKITVPAYVVASWTDQGLHSRGTMEAFKRIGSHQKWLEIHGRRKWAYYYDPESVRRQQVFYDHFLKGIDNEIREWPKVRLQVREKYYVESIRSESAWPIPTTQYTKLYLNAQVGSLERDSVAAESTCRYEPMAKQEPPPRAQFEFKFDQSCDLVGHMKLKLWMTAEGSDDMDLFVAVEKWGADGKLVAFPFFNQHNGPVAIGWLRASHREQDPERSTEYQPFLRHRRELKLAPGETVPLEIEILPSGTRFHAGETLRLIVQGKDVYPQTRPTVQNLHEDSVNRGFHVIHAGGRYDSHLLVPVLGD